MPLATRALEPPDEPLPGRRPQLPTQPGAAVIEAVTQLAAVAGDERCYEALLGGGDRPLPAHRIRDSVVDQMARPYALLQRVVWLAPIHGHYPVLPGRCGGRQQLPCGPHL